MIRDSNFFMPVMTNKTVLRKSVPSCHARSSLKIIISIKGGNEDLNSAHVFYIKQFLDKKTQIKSRKGIYLILDACP